MPVWSWEELKFCQTQVYPWVTDDDLFDQFSLWGGIARAIFLCEGGDGKGQL